MMPLARSPFLTASTVLAMPAWRSTPASYSAFDTILLRGLAVSALGPRVVSFGRLGGFLGPWGQRGGPLGAILGINEEVRELRGKAGVFAGRPAQFVNG